MVLTSFRQQFFRGFLDAGQEFIRQLCQQRQHGASLSDARQGHGVMQHQDGAVGIALIFQRQEDLADLLGTVIVLSVNGAQQVHAQVGGDAYAAGGEAGDAKVTQMDDGRLLTDAADDEVRVHQIHQLRQVEIIGRVGFHHRVFDPGDQAVIHQLSRMLGGDVGFVLDVEHQLLTGDLGQLTDGGHHASGLGGEQRRQQHGGGEVVVLQDRRLIHRRAIHGADAGHHPQVILRGQVLQHAQQGIVFRDGDVVEIGIASVEKGADAPGVEMLDQLVILLTAEAEIVIPAQGRDGDDGAAEVGGRDRAVLHRKSGAVQERGARRQVN